MIGLHFDSMPSRIFFQPGMSRSESLVPSAWIFSSTVYGPCRWQMDAPASTQRTYSAATASTPCGGGLGGCDGKDIVESHVAVMISLSMRYSFKVHRLSLSRAGRETGIRGRARSLRPCGGGWGFRR